MNIETLALPLSLLFFASSSLAGAMLSRHTVKLVFYLSSVIDAVLFVIAVFSCRSEINLQEAADIFIAAAVAIKFALNVLLIAAVKSHENENPSLNKDYRPKSYD